MQHGGCPLQWCSMLQPPCHSSTVDEVTAASSQAASSLPIWQHIKLPFSLSAVEFAAAVLRACRAAAKRMLRLSRAGLGGSSPSAGCCSGVAVAVNVHSDFRQLAACTLQRQLAVTDHPLQGACCSRV